MCARLLVARELLRDGGMHPLVFAAKRAYQSMLYKVAYKVARPFGLTPARIDLLYRLLQRWSAGGAGPFQHQICEALGVSGPVVSRMIRALEEQGLVARRRVREDGRKKRVLLTRRGLERIRRALGEIMGLGLVQRLLEAGYTRPSERFRFTSRTARIVIMLTTRLRELAKRQGDSATLHYPAPYPVSYTPPPDPAEVDDLSVEDLADLPSGDAPWEDNEYPPSSPDLSDHLAE